MRVFWGIFFAAAAGVFLLVKPEAASKAASEAVSDCLEIIVPSLFAFSALSIYLQKSGLYKKALKPFVFVLSKLLRLDEELCGIFLLANIGGYPVGANLLSRLVSEKRISEKDAARLLFCCFGSGPSFVVGIVGARVFGSAAAGAALFLALFLSSVIMALFVRAGGEIALEKNECPLSVTSKTFVESVKAAARAMFSVCVMVIIFAAIAAMLRECGAERLFSAIFSPFGENGEKIFPALLDVTRVKNFSPTRGALPVCAGLLSFGGCCVFLQTAAVAGNIPLKRFLLSRIPAAGLSSGLAFLFSLFLPEKIEEAFLSGAAAAPFSGSAALSLCVLAMSGILLLEKA